MTLTLEKTPGSGRRSPIRGAILTIVLVGGLVTGAGAAAAQSGPGGPCTNPDTQCGLGGYDPKQSTQVRGDEYQACNPDGQAMSPANEDVCENGFAHNGERPGGAMPSGDAQDRVFRRFPPLTDSK